MNEPSTPVPDTEESLLAELEAIQQERVDFEREQHKQIADRAQADAAQRRAWQKGLLAIQRKHVAATRRLELVRAARIRAAAIESQREKPRQPEHDLDA